TARTGRTGGSAMVDVIRVSRDDNPTPEARREWLVTNGLGGFASATISGEITRRYHGFLIAALPAPQGRIVMLNDLDVAVGRSDGRHYEIAAGSGLPVLRLMISGCDATSFTADGGSRHECDFVTEEQRGYDARGSLWSPGYFTVELQPDSIATLIAATEPWHTVEALHPEAARRFETERRRRLVAMAPPAAREGLAAELVLAADSFIITPVGRVADIVRAHAEGDEMRTVIAGYHWFTDWGRDAMISLEGLTLATGRVAEGKWILRAFAHYVRDGLIPNMFPEGDCEGLYHTADATLWFFHALARYVEYTGDRATLTLILPKLQEIVRLHLEGTRFGIKADPRDGLLSQGAEGYQLTWMDAKVGDWVVTPR